MPNNNFGWTRTKSDEEMRDLLAMALEQIAIRLDRIDQRLDALEQRPVF